MMFVVFSADGAPLRFGHCPANAFDAQALAGETVIEWDDANGSPADWLLIDGVLTPAA